MFLLVLRYRRGFVERSWRDPLAVIGTQHDLSLCCLVLLRSAQDAFWLGPGTKCGTILVFVAGSTCATSAAWLYLRRSSMGVQGLCNGVNFVKRAHDGQGRRGVVQIWIASA